jgi:RNA polymerase sigma factor (TIGR02999 family)
MALDDQDKPVNSNDLRDLIGELRLMARRFLVSESEGHSFTPTALAMTALRRAKLTEEDWENVQWENRQHFFACLARAMRHALIDHARKRKSKGRDKLVYLAPDELVSSNLVSGADDRPEQVVLLEEALSQLEQTNERLARVVEQFYYLNYSVKDIARFAGVSEKTVDRDLNRARITLERTIQKLAKD